MKEHQKYSQERREQALQRVALRTDNQTIESIAALVDVNVGTLKNWMKAAKKQSASAGLNKPASAYTAPQQLDALLETGKLNDAEVSAWCREKGLFPHDLSAWRQSLTAPRSDESVQLREVRRERPMPMKVIATGGLAALFAQGTETFDAIEDDLTMHGLVLIHALNKAHGFNEALDLNTESADGPDQNRRPETR